MRLTALLLSFSLSIGAPAAAQPGPPWPNPAGNPHTAVELEALSAEFPGSATLVRRMLAAAFDAGDAERIRRSLARLADLGYAPTAGTLDRLSVHVPAPEMAALRQRFEAYRAPLGASRAVADVPTDHRLVEGVARDRSRDRLFATTVVGRQLLVQEGRGWRVVQAIAGGSLFGLAVDQARGLLWVASGVVEQTPAPAGAFRGLIAVDLRTLRVVRRVPVAGRGSPADIAVGADGTVYASDPATGAIYRAAAGASELAILLPAGRLNSPQGLATAADGRRLYVSDYGRGLASVSLVDGSINRLPSDAGTMLDGIDGLVRVGGTLVAIQNGTNPRRILALRLDRAGDRIIRAHVLEQANPAWGEPTLGTVRRGELVYVADAQWERYGPGGEQIGGGALRPTAIRALALPR